MVVRARDKCCQARPIEVAGCSARVAVGMVRLQPLCYQLQPPMHAVDALSAWRIPCMTASSLVGGGRAWWCGHVTSAAKRDRSRWQAAQHAWRWVWCGYSLSLIHI